MALPTSPLRVSPVPVSENSSLFLSGFTRGTASYRTGSKQRNLLSCALTDAVLHIKCASSDLEAIQL